LHGVAAVGFDPGTRFLGIREGATTQQSSPVLLR
jgi:hypothetical protein